MNKSTMKKMKLETNGGDGSAKDDQTPQCSGINQVMPKNSDGEDGDNLLHNNQPNNKAIEEDQAPQCSGNTQVMPINFEGAERDNLKQTLKAKAKILPKIKLKTNDDVIFETDIQVAQCSDIIHNMLKSCGWEEGDNAVIPLENVSSAIFSLILEWAEYHKDDVPLPSILEEDEPEDKRSDDISEWDGEFIRNHQGSLFQLVLAANFLEVKGLLALGCKTVANMIKGKTAREIRDTFGITNDFTKEQEAALLQENSWCEEF